MPLVVEHRDDNIIAAIDAVSENGVRWNRSLYIDGLFLRLYDTRADRFFFLWTFVLGLPVGPASPTYYTVG